MAASLLLLLDDITSVLDDVALMTKVAAKKTAGVLGDDLALNAQQVSGVCADRELPVVWAVARGSLLNKAILVPAALVIATLAPWAVTPLLMLGGAYLCFEGVEKLAHRRPKAPTADAPVVTAGAPAGPADADDPAAWERTRIRGAIRTDFILSAEIVVIALGTVAGAPLAQQATVLAAIGVAMTAGVYGLVAGIVKLDDAGCWLSRRPGVPARWLGGVLLGLAPWLMKALSVVGTLAMFLVGGGILAHGLHPLQAALDGLAAGGGALLAAVVPLLGQMAVGVVAGALVLAAVTAARRWRGPPAGTRPVR